MMKLKDRVAVVTGAGRGIGEAIAKKLASEGARIAVVDMNIDQANRVTGEIRKQGGSAQAFKADVGKRNEVRDLIDKTLQIYREIHVLVNNAGITRHKPILQITEEDWDSVLNVDLKGVFNCTQAVLEHMMSQRYGKIINISSLAGLGASNEGMANYAAAKAGVIALTKVTAREAGPYGINVNCVAPGTIVTSITYEGRGQEGGDKFIEERKKLSVLGRVGQPEDIANLVLFIASDDSSYMTGQIIRMDGGRKDLM